MIPPFCDPVVLTERSSSPSPTKKLVLVSLSSTRARCPARKVCLFFFFFFILTFCLVSDEGCETTRADINFEELARCTQDFNGAMLKAVCVEAGMIALRREATKIEHEDFVEGISQVQAKKKKNLAYYA